MDFKRNLTYTDLSLINPKANKIHIKYINVFKKKGK